MASLKLVLNYLEKFCLGIWGLSIIDLIPMIDFKVFEALDMSIQKWLAIVGVIYLLIQIPFKIIELNQKRKMNDLERRLKEEELERKERENDFYVLRGDAKDNLNKE